MSTLIREMLNILDETNVPSQEEIKLQQTKDHFDKVHGERIEAMNREILKAYKNIYGDNNTQRDTKNKERLEEINNLLNSL